MTSTRRPATPEEFEAIRARLAGLSHSEKVDLASRTKPIAEKRGEKQESHKQKHSVPKTDDELHEAIKRDTGYDIPRVAVCEDHCAPFAPIADGFFNRQNQILIMKSREAGGTLNVSILQYEKCKYVPRHEGVTFGAIEQQARRAYEYVQTFTFEETEDAEGNVTRTVKSEIEGEPMRSKTKWKHGSSLMVIIGTVSGVNSPHPNTVHCDELDIMGRDVWLESRNMSSSSRVAGREPIPALDVVTSTRKSMHGLMQELIDENDETIASGYEPPWAVYAYCVTPETLVRTRRGQIPIEQVEPGDYVLSRGGQFRRVSHVMARPYKGALVSLKTSTGVPIRLTPDHRVSTVYDDRLDCPATKPRSNRKGGYEEQWVMAGSLSVGNYVRVEVPDVSEEVMRDVIEAPKESLGPSDPDGPMGEGFCQCGCGGRPRRATHTRRGNVRGRSSRFLVGHHFIRKAHKSFELTDEFLWAIGLYVAEGNAAQGVITYSLHENEVNYIERLKSLFESFGWTTRLWTPDGTKGVQLAIYSTQLSEWWSEWIGSGCQNKRLPSEILDLPMDRLHHAMSGLLDGDGCERWDALNQTSPCVALNAVEYSLRDGGRATLSLPKSRERRRQAYMVNNTVSHDTVASRCTPKGSYQHKDHRGFWMRDGQRYAKVMGTTLEEYDGLVYDLTVEGDPSFVAGNTLIHNCVFEIAEEVPECRRAPEEQRRTRLAELNRDPCETCSCHQIIKGEWGENNPRTLESVCQGKFFKSRGWMAHEDVKRKFRNNPQVQWEAQMECRRPMADGLYLPGWSRRRFSTTGWQPRPDLGKIWLGVDWGGSAENALIWFQGPLTAPVTINGPGGQVTVPMGAYVIFDELLIANVGAGKLGDMAVAKEIAWRRQIMGFRVTARFSDPAGKQQRDDWREHNPPLKTSWYLPNRDFDPTVKVLQDLVADQRYWIDSRAARHMDDIEAWRQKNGREIHDEATHSCSAARYGLNNTEVLERRRGHKRSSNAMPVAVARPTDSSLAGIVSGGGDPFADERKWREGLGESFDNRPYGR